MLCLVTGSNFKAPAIEYEGTAIIWHAENHLHIPEDLTVITREVNKLESC